MMLSLPGSMVHIAQLMAYSDAPRLTTMNRVMRNTAVNSLERLSAKLPTVLFRVISVTN
jgi:hypothetical protein